LFANDAEVKFESSSAPISCGTIVNQTIQKIIIYNRGNTPLTSVTGNYKINEGSPFSFSWTGSLATNEFAAFPITINSNINGTIVVHVDNANGVMDQRESNNTATGSFTLPSAPTNYAFTNYIFSLQQDYYGSETTWELKNNTTGKILYSGGPYSDTYVNSSTISPIPAIITQNWALPSNQCYTFTINDSGKDGICCGKNLGGSGTGYYDLKSADGSTVIASGASFTTSEIKSFATNTAPDFTKPTLTAVADREEYVNVKCEFEIPDYTYLTTTTDNSGTVKSLEQSPKGGTKTIKGKGTVELITLTATDNKENSDFITFKITLKEKDPFLYPNPVKENIKISTSLCEPINNYTIANSLGQIVLQKEVLAEEVSAEGNITINTSILSDGIYFITITKENEKKTLRFIKD
jgi:hypothetical protein